MKAGTKTSRGDEKEDSKTQVWNILSQAYPAFRKPLTDQKVYSFIRNIEQGTVVTTSITVPAFGALNVTLGNFPGATDFTTLFDQYRISRLEIWLYAQPPATGTTNSLLGSRFCSVIDYDDSTTLASVAQATEYQTCIMTTL